MFYIKNTAQLTAKNVVEAYYDALDFKEFERAYSYLSPNSDISISQYMLEVSVTDGILSSYAKLRPAFDKKHGQYGYRLRIGAVGRRRQRQPHRRYAQRVYH